MKPFSRISANSGKAIINRSGHSCTIVSQNGIDDDKPIIVLAINEDGKAYSYAVNIHGKIRKDGISTNKDIGHPAETQKGWIAIRPDIQPKGMIARATNVYQSKSDVNELFYISEDSSIQFIEIEFEV
jgi:hypothetical protein